MSEKDNEFLEFLKGTAKTLISGYTEIELEKHELERLADLRAKEEAARNHQQTQFLGFDPAQQKQIVGISSLGAVALLTVALVLILRG